jgi:hypothetical protein
LLFVCSLVSARADQLFSISLDGLQETPPNGSPATGSGTAFFDSTASTLTLSVSFSGLVAPATGAHVHSAPFGVSGPIIIDYTPLLLPGIGTTAGSFAPVALAVAPADVSSLLVGATYLNIHSVVFPGGEIRGQLIAVPEPATVGLVGLGILGLGFALRRRVV